MALRYPQEIFKTISPTLSTSSSTNPHLVNVTPPQNLRETKRAPPYIITWSPPKEGASYLKGYIIYIVRGETISQKTGGYDIKFMLQNPLATSADLTHYIERLDGPSFTVAISAVTIVDSESQFSNTITFQAKFLHPVFRIDFQFRKIDAKTTGMLLSWDPVPGALEYKIYISEHHLDSRNLVGRVPGTRTFFVFKPVVSGVTYECVITVVDSHHVESPWPDKQYYHKISTYFQPQPINSDTLNFKLSADGTFTLASWEPVEGAYTYKVYVKQMRSKYTPVVSLTNYDIFYPTAKDQNFAKLKLLLNVPYTIAVVSEDICGASSELSKPVDVTMSV